MHTSLFGSFAGGPGWSAARLPYADGRLAMTVVVPDLGRFTEQADLSGMTTQEPLNVGAVVHEGYVAVDEAGTEAAAATAVMVVVAGLSSEPFALSADRPFLYLIHDDADDEVGRYRTPLFIGRVMDPTL